MAIVNSYLSYFTSIANKPITAAPNSAMRIMLIASSDLYGSFITLLRDCHLRL
jgi:hypothetical protein